MARVSGAIKAEHWGFHKSYLTIWKSTWNLHCPGHTIKVKNEMQKTAIENPRYKWKGQWRNNQTTAIRLTCPWTSASTSHTRHPAWPSHARLNGAFVHGSNPGNRAPSPLQGFQVPWAKLSPSSGSGLICAPCPARMMDHCGGNPCFRTVLNRSGTCIGNVKGAELSLEMVGCDKVLPLSKQCFQPQSIFWRQH